MTFDQFFLRLAETSAYTATITMIPVIIMAFGLGKGQQMIITGIIVIVAVYIDVSARRRKN